MSCCKWWNKEQDKCVHPKAPQKGDCDWYNDVCLYYEQVSEKNTQMVKQSEVEIYPKCPHCQTELEYHDQLSTDYDDMYYFVNWSAFCPQCQRTYIFVEDFKLTDRRFLDEQP